MLHNIIIIQNVRQISNCEYYHFIMDVVYFAPRGCIMEHATWFMRPNNSVAVCTQSPLASNEVNYQWQ